MEPCFLDSSTKIFKALGVACGPGGGWGVYLFRGCCGRSWGGGVLGGCGGVSFLVGLSIIGGVFMLAGGAGRWAIIYGVLGLP